MLPTTTVWQIAGRSLIYTGQPFWMGIVNVTPDSFSDGGRFFETNRAVEHALKLVRAGATILDIGGESTRPGSDGVSTAEQVRRVVPVIREIVRHTETPISIDTTLADVARAALDAGAAIINDTSAAEDDPDMLPLLSRTDAGVCIMHRQGRPRTMQEKPVYRDVVAEVYDYLARRTDELAAAGIAPERIAVDPGIGFGKTTEHNRLLLESIGRFHEIGVTVLVGHSRKRFLGDLYPELDRDAATALLSCRFADAGVQVIRIHNVAAQTLS